MGDRTSRVDRPLGQSAATQKLRAKRLRQRKVVVGSLGLLVVVFAEHWVWSLIAALLTLFLVYGLDDEILELEREPKDQ